MLANEVSMEVIWNMDEGQKESVHHFLVVFLWRRRWSVFLRAQLNYFDHFKMFHF